MRMPFRGLAVAAAIALVAACDNAPTQPPLRPSSVPGANAAVDPGVIRDSDEYIYDLTDYTVALGCLDGTESEVVRLRGSIAERSSHIQLPTGTVQYWHQTRPIDLWGVGLTTGQEYDVLRTNTRHDSYADRGVLGVSREVWELRNRVTGALFHLTYAVQYRMDEDRNIIAHRERERVACR